MQKKSLIDISFITVNYNGLTDTQELIQSLATHVKSVSYEIIVVDNASRNPQELECLKDIPLVHFIQAPDNLGFAGGNNLGLSETKGNYLFFINNDTYITEDHFNDLILFYEQTAQIGILCPKLRFSQTPNNIQYAGFTELSNITLRNKGIGYGEPDNGQYNTPTQTYFAHGAAMMIAREVLEKVGPMSEDYFLYYEEMDWSTRIRRKGYSIWYHPVQTIYHKESQSTGQSSPLKSYYLTRNRLKYALKFRTGMTRILTILYLIGLVGLRDVVMNVIHKRIDLSRATIKGINDFLFHPTRIKASF